MMNPNKTVRQMIAEEAARLLHEEGYRDYLLAKNKAVERLGYSGNKTLQPTNQEIHDAFLMRKQSFESKEEKQHLKELRQIAREAMEFLKDFSPQLTGSVMDGTTGFHTPITLHLYSSAPEEVIMFLADHKIPFQTHERKLRTRGKQESHPLLRFYVDDKEIELVLLDSEQSTPPTCPISGKAMKRMNIKAVKQLILDH
jgi:hypothetical protein